MDLRRIGNALRLRNKDRSDAASLPSSCSERKTADLDPSWKKRHTSSLLIADPRYRPALLAAGQRRFANLSPPRGSLNDEKIDYFTWRLQVLFVQQLEHERLATIADQQDEKLEEKGRTAQQAAQLRDDVQHPRSHIRHRSSSSIVSSAPSSSSSSSSTVPQTDKQQPSDDLFARPGSTAMVRLANEQQGVGWIDADQYGVRMAVEAKSALRQALVADDVLAGMPTLKRTERHFASLAPGTMNVKVHQRRCYVDEDQHLIDGEADEGDRDSLFECFYDVASGQASVHRSDPHEPLPPPLLPASSFHRASFGVRTRPDRSFSSNSVPTKAACGRKIDTGHAHVAKMNGRSFRSLRALLSHTLVRRSASESNNGSLYSLNSGSVAVHDLARRDVDC